MLNSCSNPVVSMKVSVEKIDTYTQPNTLSGLACAETGVLLHMKRSLTTRPIHTPILNFLSVVRQSSTLSTPPIMKTTNLYKGLI